MQREVLPQMTVKEITDVINNAIVQNRTVKIQTNKCDSNGIFEPPVSGKINGFVEEKIHINSNELIKFNEIRSVVNSH